MAEVKDYCYLDPEEVGENVVIAGNGFQSDTFLIEKNEDFARGLLHKSWLCGF